MSDRVRVSAAGIGVGVTLLALLFLSSSAPRSGSAEDWCRAAGEDPVRLQVQGGKGGYVVLCKHPTGVLSVPREPKE